MIDPVRLHNFIQTYQQALTETHTAYPQEYRFPASELPRVVERMGDAFARGSFNKDSRAVKATCRALNIKHTYTAIRSYLEGAK